MGSLLSIMSAVPAEVKHIIEPALNPYQQTIAASGIVEAADKNISIGAPEEGIVARLFVKVGDTVEKSAPLFQLDVRTLEAELIAQEAVVEVKVALLARLQDQYNRLKTVSDPRAISVDELKTKENDVRVAEAELASSRAALLKTKKLIERLTVCAPIGGVILQNNIREGEYVSKNNSTLILGNIDHVQVRADIDEQNAGWFNPNNSAIAYPKNNTNIPIKLRFVRVEPYVVPKVSLTGSTGERVDTRVLQVIYAFDQPDNYHVYVGQQIDLFINRKLDEAQNETRR